MGSAKCWKTTHPILLALLLMLNCQHSTVAAAKLASFTQHASANSDAASPIASPAASSAAGPIPFEATSTLQAGSPSSGMAAGPVPSFADVTPAPRQPLFGYGPASGPTESDFLQSIPGSGLLPGQDLSQACQSLDKMYMQQVMTLAKYCIYQGVLMPSQLSQTGLDALSAQYPMPADQNPMTALMGGYSFADFPACADLENVLQIYYDLMMLLQLAGAPAPAPLPDTLQAAAPASSHEQAQTPTPDDDNSAPAPAPDAVEFIREENAASPLLAPMPGPAFAPSPLPISAIINYNGEDMPADDACQLMTGDISQAIASTTAALCQLPAPACMQAANIMVSEIESFLPSGEELYDLGIATDPADYPKCLNYLRENHILSALLALSDQYAMVPAPAQIQAPLQTAPAMSLGPVSASQLALPPLPSPANGLAPDPCALCPVPTLIASRYVATTVVNVQLQFPAGFSPPACAPSCLISLSCGQAGLDPNQLGYSFGAPIPDISANGSYPLTLYFPYAANYPLQGMQPPIITSCISYASDPCASAPLTHLGDITFDATKPTLTISKVSEQFGNPTSATARKLQQTAAPLFALMLFNFSKEVGNLTADQILLTGGTVTEIIPVPDTHDYFVWVEVTPGVAALHIALTPGSMTDMAGNILYSDPTNPQVFTIISNNGQYSGIITYPSPPPPASTMSTMTTAAAQLLSKGAIAGIVIGVFFGFLIMAAIVGVTFAVLRRRRALQRESNIVSGAKAVPPKNVVFTGPPIPAKSA